MVEEKNKHKLDVVITKLNMRLQKGVYGEPEEVTSTHPTYNEFQLICPQPLMTTSPSIFLLSHFSLCCVASRHNNLAG
jgi:hypothetical protein